MVFNRRLRRSGSTKTEQTQDDGEGVELLLPGVLNHEEDDHEHQRNQKAHHDTYTENVHFALLLQLGFVDDNPSDTCTEKAEDPDHETYGCTSAHFRYPNALIFLTTEWKLQSICEV